MDECFPPELAGRLSEVGSHGAIHPRDYGRLGDPDHIVFRLVWKRAASCRPPGSSLPVQGKLIWLAPSQ